MGTATRENLAKFEKVGQHLGQKIQILARKFSNIILRNFRIWEGAEVCKHCNLENCKLNIYLQTIGFDWLIDLGHGLITSCVQRIPARHVIKSVWTCTLAIMYHTFFTCNICCTLRLLIGIFTFSFPTCCTVLWFCTVFGMILCCTVFGMLHSFLVFLFRAQQLWGFTTIFHQSRRTIIQINQSVA